MYCVLLAVCMDSSLLQFYLRVLLCTSTDFKRILKITDLVGINFSDFAITCSIYLQMCGVVNLILRGTSFRKNREIC